MQPGTGVDADYLYFLAWSEHVMGHAKTLVTGSTPSRQRVNPSAFYDLRVPIPPLPEQKRIARVLSTVQRAIDVRDRVITTTTELRHVLMGKLFSEGLRGEPQAQTEIGLVPKGWDLRRIRRYRRRQRWKALAEGRNVF